MLLIFASNYYIFNRWSKFANNCPISAHQQIESFGHSNAKHCYWLLNSGMSSKFCQHVTWTFESPASGWLVIKLQGALHSTSTKLQFRENPTFLGKFARRTQLTPCPYSLKLIDLFLQNLVCENVLLTSIIICRALKSSSIFVWRVMTVH